MNGDVDERVWSGHPGTCLSNCRHLRQINRFLIARHGFRVQQGATVSTNRVNPRRTRENLCCGAQ
ncbi:unnamed protein product [Ciceribacter selenitireducens ATCC BAA-1503]|uniref:Uncharacterized protein n=1 Tax=Ciceribacter selenitireducens ATCC BAA-1503 TaxID=1336235 RepID=A0A376AC18_9HYPH|nr:unnamed protein product [Ciceribacter selenitireducens ATCC BAA-1503]